jgi:hypothetical protein
VRVARGSRNNPLVIGIPIIVPGSECKIAEVLRSAGCSYCGVVCSCAAATEKGDAMEAVEHATVNRSARPTSISMCTYVLYILYIRYTVYMP